MKTTFEYLVGHSLRIELERIDIARLPAGHTTRWRTLPSFMFSQAWEGSERMFLEDGTRIDAARGGMILLPPGIRHRVDVTSAGESRHWAHVSYTFAGGMDLFMAVDCPRSVGPSIGRAVGRLVRDWVERDRRLVPNDIGRIAANHELGARLLSLIAPVCRVRADAMDRVRGTERLAAALRHMNANMERPIRRDELARLVSLSPAQFHAVFRRLMGTTPVEYLRRLRLGRAQQMLAASAVPIREIAARCGYADPFVFCKFFKRYSGHSPTEYRRLVRS